MNDKTKNILCRVALVSSGFGIFSDSVLVPLLSSIYSTFPNSGVFLDNFIVTGGYLFSFVFSMAAGYLTRAVSKRKLLIFGLICFIIGGVGPVFTTSMGYLAIMRIIDGCSDGLISVVALSLISELYTGKDRASMVGLYLGVPAACGFTMSFFAGIICLYNWKLAFLMNGVSVIPLILAVISVPETPLDTKKKVESKSTKGKIPVPAVCLLIAGFFILSALYCILFVFVDLYVVEKMLGTSVLSGIISSVGSIVSSLAGIVFAVVYVKTKRLTSVLAFAGSALSFFVLYSSSSLAAIMGSFIAAAFAYSMSYSYYQVTMCDIVPKNRVSLMLAYLNSAYNIACFVSSYIPFTIQRLFKVDTLTASFKYLAIFLTVCTVISTASAINDKRNPASKWNTVKNLTLTSEDFAGKTE